MLHNIKKVKQTDKRKMHTLLKLIGRTGIWKIQQGNWNAAPREIPLFSRRQAQSICFSPQKQKIIGKTLIFLKQAVFQDYFKVQLEIFSYFCKVYFKIFLYGQANYQKYHHREANSHPELQTGSPRFPFRRQVKLYSRRHLNF